ncbi:MAG: N-6 DNA methylase [Lachnospiraceae bacterium]|nr:N-6 DNA methylase [Lachnospiraceae bacterium]
MDSSDRLKTDLSGLKKMRRFFDQILLQKKKDCCGGMFFAAVYGAYLCEKHGLQSEEELRGYLKQAVSENRRLFVADKLCGDLSIPVEMQRSKKFTEENYCSYFRLCTLWDADLNEMKYLDQGTPLSVASLGARVLDIQPDDRVADLSCGMGDFICQAVSECGVASYYGVETYPEVSEICATRTEILAEYEAAVSPVEISQGNLFSLDRERRFTKIFFNYPLGLSVKSLPIKNEELDALYQEIPGLGKVTSADWIFNAHVLNYLEEGGRAVVIMTNGSTSNSINTKVREYFVQEGWIEAVIALPPRLFTYTHIATDLVVLSRGNRQVRMVDAGEICDKGRRQTEFSEEDVREIVRLLRVDSERSVSVGADVLRQNNYVLSPSRYLETEEEMENGVPFAKVIKRIGRGAPLTAKDLDQLVTQENTGIQYLMLSDIQNGMLSEHLTQLKTLEPKYEKYLASNRTLLISKNGAPFKVAIAEVAEGEKIVANGNLFLIELDETRVNPYYLKAYFDSEEGSLALKKIAVGASIPIISAEALGKLVIPIPPMGAQYKIAERYRAKSAEIRELQRKLEKAQDELRNVFSQAND